MNAKNEPQITVSIPGLDPKARVDGEGFASAANRRGVEHVETGDEIQDPEALLGVLEVDGPADARWLAEHPEAIERRRPATDREQRAYGLPSHAYAVVTRTEDGCILTGYCG